MNEVWYVCENDLIGGYIVGTVDKPASELLVSELRSTICETVTRERALEIANLHNESLPPEVFHG